MKRAFSTLFVIIIIAYLLSGCEYKKVKKQVCIDSLFIKDSLLVFSNTYEPKTVWENYKDTSLDHYSLEYLLDLNERIQLHKIKFLVPPEKYNALAQYIRKLPVLVITGRQYRNELTGFNLTGDFVNGKFIASQTRAMLIPFGEYLDHQSDKYKYEIIDTMPKGYATLGMTKSMIQKALGEPLKIISNDTKMGTLEQWTYDAVYKFDGTKMQLKDRKFIYFLDDRAVSIKS